MLLIIILVYLLKTFSPETKVYESIKDSRHPTFEDYEKIERYLRKGSRKKLDLLKQAIIPGGALFDYKSKARKIRFIGKNGEAPQYGVIPFRCSLNEKKICVLAYASYNQRYPDGIGLIAKRLSDIGFKGHFVYRIGGWPDLEGGSLKLAHIPYAFKPCFLKEVDRLGYELILWLDTSIRPMKSLDSIFETIENQGYFFYPSGHTLAQYCTQEAMEALNIDPALSSEIYSAAAGVFGLSLRHPIGKEIMEKWYEAAIQETPFLSPRPEQNVLSLLIYQLGLTNWQQNQGLEWRENHRDDETTHFFIDAKSIQ